MSGDQFSTPVMTIFINVTILDKSDSRPGPARGSLSFWFLIADFGFPTKEAFVLRTDAAFAALAAWEARSEAAWAPTVWT